jgi:hypothetical protein
MIDDREVWVAAVLMVKRYGDDAMLEASERADGWREGALSAAMPLAARDFDLDPFWPRANDLPILAIGGLNR